MQHHQRHLPPPTSTMGWEVASPSVALALGHATTASRGEPTEQQTASSPQPSGCSQRTLHHLTSLSLHPSPSFPAAIAHFALFAHTAILPLYLYFAHSGTCCYCYLCTYWDCHFYFAHTGTAIAVLHILYIPTVICNMSIPL